MHQVVATPGRSRPLGTDNRQPQRRRVKGAHFILFNLGYCRGAEFDHSQFRRYSA